MTTEPCPDCGMIDPPAQPGAIRMPGTPHRSDCPQVAMLRSPEADAQLRAELRAIEENERQAWIESRDVWLR